MQEYLLQCIYLEVNVIVIKYCNILTIYSSYQFVLYFLNSI